MFCCWIITTMTLFYFTSENSSPLCHAVNYPFGRYGLFHKKGPMIKFLKLDVFCGEGALAFNKSNA